MCTAVKKVNSLKNKSLNVQTNYKLCLFFIYLNLFYFAFGAA